MKLIDFLKGRLIFIFINMLLLLFTAILLHELSLDTYAIIFIVLINFLGILSFHVYDYLTKRSYYTELFNNLSSLNQKYLIADVIEEASFLEGSIVYSVIKEATKSMNDELAFLRNNNLEYREYIEMWVHEIKTPIATTRLLIENNSTPVTESIKEEIVRVEDFIEQSLFYTRSNNIEKDYIIKEINLNHSINKVIKRNSKILIERKIKIDIKDTDKIVYSDSKWIEFIIQQIISNSIKYMDKKESILTFLAKKKEDNIILTISDNGIGMNEKDVFKAFNKGYTGENGRKFGKSTGIGLYLCKKLCIKLGLGININSKVGEGTAVSILFPINKIMLMK